jgi:hypothetical protein
MARWRAARVIHKPSERDFGEHKVVTAFRESARNTAVAPESQSFASPVGRVVLFVFCISFLGLGASVMHNGFYVMIAICGAGILAYRVFTRVWRMQSRVLHNGSGSPQ